jgi:hypothetical protein
VLTAAAGERQWLVKLQTKIVWLDLRCLLSLLSLPASFAGLVGVKLIRTSSIPVAGSVIRLMKFGRLTLIVLSALSVAPVVRGTAFCVKSSRVALALVG